MRRNSVLTLVFLIAVTGCALPDGQEVSSRASAIVNGSLDNTAAIGVLIAGKNEACTATLIGPRTVLTAAHCVVNRTPVAFYHRSVDGRRYNASSVTVHPDYAGTNRADIAIVRLEKSIDGVTPLSLARRAPLMGESVTLIGFGKTGENEGEFGVKRRAENTIGHIDAQYFSFFAKGQGLGNVCDGDSGGPTLARRDGKDTVIGVHSTKGGRCGEQGNDMRVDVFRAWIEKQAQGDLTDADAAAPKVQLVSPAADSDVARKLTVSATAADDIAIVRVTLFIDGQIAAVRERAPYRFNVNISALGQHQLKVVAYDAADNRSEDIIRINVSDAVAPQSADAAIADLGAACDTSNSCSTGLCALDGATGLGFCTQQCDLVAGGCPNGATCTPAGTTAVCVLAEVASNADDSVDSQGGCNVANSEQGSEVLFGLFALLGLLIIRRR